MFSFFSSYAFRSFLFMDIFFGSTSSMWLNCFDCNFSNLKVVLGIAQQLCRKEFTSYTCNVKRLIFHLSQNAFPPLFFFVFFSNTNQLFVSTNLSVINLFQLSHFGSRWLFDSIVFYYIVLTTINHCWNIHL